MKVFTGKTDPCKLVISAADGGMTGQELYDVLREKYHLQMEMVTDRYVLAILTLMDEQEGWDRLAEAIQRIDEELAGKQSSEDKWDRGETNRKTKQAQGDAYVDCATVEKEAVMTIAEAYEQEWEKVLLAQSVGRVAAEFVNLYPPGIPLVVPGERLGEELVKELEKDRRLRTQCTGAEDGYVKVIRL